MRSRAGFSLIELLMVIAIIGIIATIAIPLLISTRRNALDEKARQSVRVVLTAQQAYYARFSTFGNFNDLSIAAPPFLDSRFTNAGADLGNGIIVTVTVDADGQSFAVEASNPGGFHDYAGDESFTVTEL